MFLVEYLCPRSSRDATDPVHAVNSLLAPLEEFWKSEESSELELGFSLRSSGLLSSLLQHLIRETRKSLCEMSSGELVIRKQTNLNVSQEAARATLREVRLQGHVYVELREVGRRTIFFCTLCLTPCYSDTSLFDHLRGNLHSRRYAAAKATLFGPVPWPFNDGVLFFSTFRDQEHQLCASTPPKDLIICPYGDGQEVTSSSNGCTGGSSSLNGKYSNLDRCDNFSSIPRVSSRHPSSTTKSSGKSTNLDSGDKFLIIPRVSSGDPSSLTKGNEKSTNLDGGDKFLIIPTVSSGDPSSLTKANGNSANLDSGDKFLSIPRVSSGDPSSLTKANGKSTNLDSGDKFSSIPRVSSGDPSSLTKLNGKSTNLDSGDKFLSIPRVSSGDPSSLTKAKGKSANLDSGDKFLSIPRVSSGDPSSTTKSNGKSTNLDSGDKFLSIPRVSSGDTSSTTKSNEKSTNLDSYEKFLTISRVSSDDPSSTTKARFTGYGHIAARICNSSDTANKIRTIWCAWLGAGDSDPGNVLLSMPKCNFGIINFPYSYDLGRPSDFDNAESSLSFESGSPRMFRKSIQTEDGEEKIESDRNFRRELRRQKRLAAERLCDICGQPMLACKDVSTLLNRKTWNIACSSRNTHGAFHVFHTSCLIHWILLCESEIWNPKIQGGRGRKGKKATKPVMSSVLCPECQGTGMIVGDDELEKPSISLSQMLMYKLKAIESHKAWMRSPEILEHCSTGLSLSSVEEKNIDEKILPLKLLHFYRAFSL